MMATEMAIGAVPRPRRWLSPDAGVAGLEALVPRERPHAMPALLPARARGYVAFEQPAVQALLDSLHDSRASAAPSLTPLG